MVVREMARQFHLGASAANDIFRPLCFGKRVQKPPDVVLLALRGARLVSEAPLSQDVLEIAQKNRIDTNMHPHILHPIHPPPRLQLLISSVQAVACLCVCSRDKVCSICVCESTLCVKAE